MKTSIELDEELTSEVARTVSLIREKPATVLRMAIRAGLPLVAARFQASRPEGYFTDDYARDERVEFEVKMADGAKQRPER